MSVPAHQEKVPWESFASDPDYYNVIQYKHGLTTMGSRIICSTV